MNEIYKFRAWINDSYLERSGYYKDKLVKEKIDKLGRMRKVHSMHLNKKKVIITSAWGGNISMSFNDVELMRYTGLKDRNGVEIFDGDIVLDWEEESAVVIWNNGSCRYELDYGNYQVTFEHCCVISYKVIGNIYENPELLEKNNA